MRDLLNFPLPVFSAYRLLKQRSPNMAQEKLIQKTTDLVEQVHFNYKASNRAPFMRNQSMKVITHFWLYSQNMAYFLGRNASLALNMSKFQSAVEKHEARRTFAAFAAVGFVMFGVTGMPGAGLLIDILSAALSDDEPVDAKIELRN
ncbi:hypothetical protein [Vibrio coralliirubri]|uniref:hypothetical protein n=1 Tax=Vibrio coralliirubri TaxID=1516159 RepID=UPI000A3AC54E|nr:hypothetical protein [Vibrio coralliirubri]